MKGDRVEAVVDTGQGVQTERVGPSGGVQHGPVGAHVAMSVLAGRGVGLGAGALLGHQPAEALLVNREAGL